MSDFRPLHLSTASACVNCRCLSACLCLSVHSTMTLSLAPPPTEGSYESVSDALKALNTFAAAEGYAIVKRRSKSWGGEVRAVLFEMR
jgi:hypothetical protein